MLLAYKIQYSGSLIAKHGKSGSTFVKIYSNKVKVILEQWKFVIFL